MMNSSASVLDGTFFINFNSFKFYGDDGDLENERFLRTIFGDDPVRVYIDKIKHEKGLYNFNVLWTIKKGFKVKVIDPHLMM